MENTTLLCTFTTRENLDDTLHGIFTTHALPFGKVYVLLNTHDNDELFCTYNAEVSSNGPHPPNTIQLNRKKQTNTLYTINAINVYVKQATGIEKETRQIDWVKFKNTILLAATDAKTKKQTGVRVIRTKLLKIVDVPKNT